MLFIKKGWVFRGKKKKKAGKKRGSHMLFRRIG